MLYSVIMRVDGGQYRVGVKLQVGVIANLERGMVTGTGDEVGVVG